ncbi:hypothetical protein ACFQWF_10020 [Methylorubrum suomiense]
MSIDERGAAARKALGAKTARGYFLDPARRPLAALLVGAACLGLVALLHGLPRLAPAYLAAWTCLLALPAGALPVAIMIERADAWRPQPETALLETLRGLLALMPVAALLALPIPFLAPFLYPWAQGAKPGPGRRGPSPPCGSRVPPSPAVSPSISASGSGLPSSSPGAAASPGARPGGSTTGGRCWASASTPWSGRSLPTISSWRWTGASMPPPSASSRWRRGRASRWPPRS